MHGERNYNHKVYKDYHKEHYYFVFFFVNLVKTFVFLVVKRVINEN